MNCRHLSTNRKAIPALRALQAGGATSYQSPSNLRDWTQHGPWFTSSPKKATTKSARKTLSRSRDQYDKTFFAKTDSAKIFMNELRPLMSLHHHSCKINKVLPNSSRVLLTRQNLASIYVTTSSKQTSFDVLVAVQVIANVES